MKFPQVIACGTGNKYFSNSSTGGVFTDLNLDTAPDKEISTFNITPSIHFWAISYDECLVIYTKDYEKNVFDPANIVKKEIKFNSLITSICSNEQRVLILLQNGEFHQYDVEKQILRELNFLNVQVNNDDQDKNLVKEFILLIACGSAISVAISNLNYVYNIPNRTYQFPKHIKVVKVCCGNEHCLLLTRNGDVYSWGTGLRGQLGHGEILNEEEPKLIDALAGIKIIDISAGSWHSAAVSSFGDLYTWGWNSHGQLGIKIYKNKQHNDHFSKNAAVYPLPKLIEPIVNDEAEELQIVEVSCGSKHTVLRTEHGKYYATGSNRHQQLGLDSKDEKVDFQFGNTKEEIYIDKFTEIINSNLNSKCKLLCNYLSSIWIHQ